jgi:hypothetical protein
VIHERPVLFGIQHFQHGCGGVTHDAGIQ